MNLSSLRARVTTWYVGLLAAALLVFGATLYFGVQNYLKSTLQRSLSGEAMAIQTKFLAFEEEKGQAWMAGEITEAYAPEISRRFIRITRQDGTALYQSGDTHDPFIDASLISHRDVATADRSFRQESQRDSERLMIYSLPYTSISHTRYLIEMGTSLTPIEHALSTFLKSLLFITPLILLAAALGGHFLMARPLRPLVALTDHAERIGTQVLGERLPVIQTGDEMERLSLSLNRMITRLEDALSHNRRFSADVSHELRTPLTILRGEFEHLVQNPVLPFTVTESIGSALEEIDRMAKIVESLLAIARLDSGADGVERQPVDLSLLARWTVDQMHLLADEKHIALDSIPARPALILADPSRMKQVLVNLIDNAIKYTPERGSVTVSVQSTERAAILEVRDTGIGIPAASLPHVFDRFYRSDKARSRQSGGAGLGLSIVKAIVNAHTGKIDFESIEGMGTTVRLELPLHLAESAPPVATAPLRRIPQPEEPALQHHA